MVRAWAEQVAALQPRVHVLGHTHHEIDQTIGGTRFMQRPLGSPLERKALGKQGVELALAWEEDATPPSARRAAMRRARSAKAFMLSARQSVSSARRSLNASTRRLSLVMLSAMRESVSPKSP